MPAVAPNLSYHLPYTNDSTKKVKYTNLLKFHFKSQLDSLSHTHDQKSGKTFETKRLEEHEEVHFRLTYLNQIWNCTKIDQGEHIEIPMKYFRHMSLTSSTKENSVR
jgi:hypothetical protein